MSIAETICAEQVDLEPSDSGLATSVNLPFEAVAKVVDLSVPLRRPKKCAPSREGPEMQEELAAWDAASDEAFQVFEDRLEE